MPNNAMRTAGVAVERRQLGLDQYCSVQQHSVHKAPCGELTEHIDEPFHKALTVEHSMGGGRPGSWRGGM